MGYDVLFRAYDLVERIGAPVAIAAWLTVFLGSIGMAWALRRHALRPHLGRAIVLGLVTMAAHASDIGTTLYVSPDLALEGNPIWLVVVERWGLGFALAYGATGKFLLGVLNVEMYLWYRVTRHGLFPAEASGFREFARRLGDGVPARFGVRWRRIASLFAYVFGYLGVWSFYVAFQNLMGGTNEAVYAKLPPPPVVIVAGLLVLAGAYFVESWLAFRRARLSIVAETPWANPRPNP